LVLPIVAGAGKVSVAMIASSMNAEVLMLQRALEVRQGCDFRLSASSWLRLDVGLRGRADLGRGKPPVLAGLFLGHPWRIQQQT
jgi:hypothetical protein